MLEAVVELNRYHYLFKLFGLAATNIAQVSGNSIYILSLGYFLPGCIIQCDFNYSIAISIFILSLNCCNAHVWGNAWNIIVVFSLILKFKRYHFLWFFIFSHCLGWVGRQLHWTSMGK